MKLLIKILNFIFILIIATSCKKNNTIVKKSNESFWKGHIGLDSSYTIDSSSQAMSILFEDNNDIVFYLGHDTSRTFLRITGTREEINDNVILTVKNSEENMSGIFNSTKTVFVGKGNSGRGVVPITKFYFKFYKQ